MKTTSPSTTTTTNHALQRIQSQSHSKSKHKINTTLIFIALILISTTTQTQAQNAEPETFIDSRDGRIYRAVEMPDGETWMAQNLNYEAKNGSWCYADDPYNCEIYGRLYDWASAQTACPAGWRLPSFDEWDALALAVGFRKAGIVLKSATGWRPHRIRAVGTNDFGFSALPGGYRWNNRYVAIGIDGVWWTSTEWDALNARCVTMYNFSDGVLECRDNKNDGRSVRCVRD